MDEYNAGIQGRIIALELAMRGLLTILVMAKDDPGAYIAELESGFVASLQHIERPIGDDADQIWERAADAISMMFGQVAQRVAYLRSRTTD